MSTREELEEELKPTVAQLTQANPLREDPTEQLAVQLGLDYRLLSHHTGLLGTDVNGAVARLRFMLAHPGYHGSFGVKPPHHQKLTSSATLKRRYKRKPDVPVLQLPTPPTAHEQQARACCFNLLQLPLSGNCYKRARVVVHGQC
jgi:hypothetical protein